MRNTGSILWDKAKSIIPGGNQLLSKGVKGFYLVYGLLTLKNQKDVKFGIWIITIIMIFL